MTEPKPYKLKDGTTRWRVQFRPAPGANPTTERFSTPEEAWKFIELGEVYGWATAWHK